MNKHYAKQLSDKIDNMQLQEMLDEAKTTIKDWTIASNVNKGISKGIAWNILAKNFDINEWHHPIVKYNLIREFGEYLPEYLKPKPKEKSMAIKISHQDPEFN